MLLGQDRQVDRQGPPFGTLPRYLITHPNWVTLCYPQNAEGIEAKQATERTRKYRNAAQQRQYVALALPQGLNDGDKDSVSHLVPVGKQVQ